MKDPLTCVVAADDDRVHRYVAGTLDADAAAAFEVHLLGCAECQRAVREGAGVSAALRMAPSPARVGRRHVWRWTVPLAAAAALALWLVAGREGPLQRLGRVGVAPTFAGVPVRADADSASRLADRGMAAYVVGRYPEATHLLGAVAADDRTPALAFYLGISRLLSGNPTEAIDALRSVPAESPYSAEARFYLAKAWLRLGRADTALAALAAVPAGSRVASRAAALADSVKGVLR